MLSFDWPWLALVLPLPWLLRALVPPAPLDGALLLPIARELQSVSAPQHESAPQLRLGVALLAWLCLVIAAMQPRWVGEAIPLPVNARDLMLAVDVSGSMAETDMQVGRRRASRLAAVQAMASEFINGRVGDRLGLILFGTQAYVYAPLSLDRETVSTLLKDAEVGLAGQETAIGDAIGLAAKQLRDSPAEERVLILLTDGVNTAGSLQPDKAVELAQAAGLRVHTIGFGSDGRSGMFGLFNSGGAQIDERQLQRIAQVSGGQYFRARDLEELQAVYAELDRIEAVEVTERSYRPKRGLGHWPLAAFALLATGLLISRMRRS